MKNGQGIYGHAAAAFSVIVWGTTFISTKLLLQEFAPAEILFFRLTLGIIALSLVSPGLLRVKDRKHELLFALAGLCGVTLYFLLENTALTCTTTANVSVITSTAPFFTAMITHFTARKKEKLGIEFFIGFVAAMAGIAIMSFAGSEMKVNPLGDLLALGASVSWAAYSVLLRRIGDHGYSSIRTTRRIFLYGLLFMIPVLIGGGHTLDVTRFRSPQNLFNILFLGTIASALCFVVWSVAVRKLGASKTTVYIYLVPVVAITASAIILKEPITPPAVIGTLLSLVGLILSESHLSNRLARLRKPKEE